MKPLAYRIRPTSFTEFSGQQHLVGMEGNIRKLLEANLLHSFILFGPPGTGKTTLASIIAHQIDAHFVELNATEAKVSTLRKHCDRAKDDFRAYQRKTIIFIDEIHRFNKAQQDVLLPYVETGDIILIGATTENPSYEINSALLSRVTVYKLKPLNEQEMIQILERALANGFQEQVRLTPEVTSYLVNNAGGDARTLLNSLELLIESKKFSSPLEEVQKFLQKRARNFDKKGDEHYNTISAFIKSLRGSDVDASLVWLWKMIDGGEDPKFIFRRMLILASEDIGMADPQALVFVNNAFQAFEKVGLPEGEYFLNHACVYLAKAPKNNDITRAMKKTKRFVKDNIELTVPIHLTKEGKGKYLYPHNYPNNWVEQVYWPVNVKKETLYEEKN